MSKVQPAVLEPIPAVARHLFFMLNSGRDAKKSLKALARLVDGESVLVGIGASLAQALRRGIDGLAVFPHYAGAGFEVPSTPFALWLWLRGDDRGVLLHRSLELEAALAPAFSLVQAIDAFRYRNGLDLSGYEDGTENPKGAKAIAAAVRADGGPGIAGSSYAAIQQWVHDMDALDAMSPKEQDNVIGRRKRDNVELARAPASAHVKRTAQESFAPEAFVVRRSMPWSDEQSMGFAFLAFGCSFAAFGAQLRRMVGAEDGIADALFRFTRPVTGAYFWCPPLKRGRLDLSALGI